MIALTLFSLISISSNTYTPVLEKSYETHVPDDMPINNWQFNETYKCPMSYPGQEVIITSSTEIAIVETRTKN